MRKLTFGGATSLDNFLARSDHGVDWLMWSPEAGEVTKSYWKTIDTVLMGRKTYQVGATNGNRNGYPGVHNYVFSRTMTARDIGDGVQLVSDDAPDFVRALKMQIGKDICLMGGGELARSLFEYGLIDEIGFNIHPVLLGTGIPAFHSMPRQIDLELIECRPFANGCVYVTYRVKH